MWLEVEACRREVAGVSGEHVAIETLGDGRLLVAAERALGLEDAGRVGHASEVAPDRVLCAAVFAAVRTLTLTRRGPARISALCGALN